MAAGSCSATNQRSWKDRSGAVAGPISSQELPRQLIRRCNIKWMVPSARGRPTSDGRRPRNRGPGHLGAAMGRGRGRATRPTHAENRRKHRPSERRRADRPHLWRRAGSHGRRTGQTARATVSREGARFAIQLIAPAENGLIHEDDDFRTPLRRITCPTCVGRIAKSRTRRREDAFGKREGPNAIAEHSRQVAEAYTRLAEIEEALEDRRNSETFQK